MELEALFVERARICWMSKIKVLTELIRHFIHIANNNLKSITKFRNHFKQTYLDNCKYLCNLYYFKGIFFEASN